MTSFALKCIACISMFLDHIKYSNPIFQNFVTEYFGRIAFPLFAFLITEGYCHTSDLKKYYKRLLIFGIISQIPFMLFRSIFTDGIALNIMFTLMFGLFCITLYDKIKSKFISIPLIIFMIVLGELLKLDYGWFGVLSVFIIYLFRNKKMFLPLVYGICIFVYYYTLAGRYIFETRVLLYIFFTWITTFLMNFYNGKKGKSMKFFFYLFYPIHMIGLYALYFVL